MIDPSSPDRFDSLTPDRDRQTLPRGAAGVAWILIGLAIAGLFVLKALQPVDPSADRNDPLGLTVLKLQARVFVGLHASGFDTQGQAIGSMKALNTGTIGQRLRVAAATAEVETPEAGLEVLNDLRTALDDQAEVTMTEDEERTFQLLETLFQTDATQLPAGAAISEDSRKFLREQLDWFGDLALVRIDSPDAAGNATPGPEMPARSGVIAPALRLAVVMIVGAAGGIGAGVVGFGALVALVVMAFLGMTRSGIRTDGSHYGVYAETFFVWFVLFFGLNTASAYLPWGLGGTLAAFFLSLIALAYPVIRGIPWARVRADIGWTLGRKPALEPLLGPVGYAICLPLLAVGLIMTLMLMTLDAAMNPIGDPAKYLGPTGGPAHPIVGMIEQGDVLAILLVFAVASIAAPIVEETFFRGVLYAHLRHLSRRAEVWVSIIFASLVNAFIFAVIHPQGLVAVPALMSLAIGMTILREWRGTLIPSILIHGISNGIVMTFMTVGLSG